MSGVTNSLNMEGVFKWRGLKSQGPLQGPYFKGEKTLLYKGNKFLVASTMKVYVIIPLTKGYLSSKDRIVWQKA